MGAVDDVEFHRRIFGLEHMTPVTVSALLWELMADKSDSATSRVAGWTKSLYGAARRRNHFVDRGDEAARLAETLSCPIGTVQAIPSVNESWDGSGLPHGIAGEEIPIGSRILAVAQSAAICGEDAGPIDVAERLERNSGTRFDPAIVEEALSVLASASPNTPLVWVEHMACDTDSWRAIDAT